MLFGFHQVGDCSNKNEAKIPDSILDYINKQYAPFKVAENNDFVYDWCHYYTDSAASPYFVTADFDNDNKNEYCLIIKSADRVDYKIIIVDQDKNELFSTIIFQTPDSYRQYKLKENKFDFGLELCKPDSITNPLADKHPNIKSEFIKIKSFEKSERVLYWTGNRYDLIFIGD